MNNSKKEKKEREPVDPQLDAPSVANEDKHINFLEEEEKAQRSSGRMDARSEADEKRKKGMAGRY